MFDEVERGIGTPGGGRPVRWKSERPLLPTASNCPAPNRQRCSRVENDKQKSRTAALIRITKSAYYKAKFASLEVEPAPDRDPDRCPDNLLSHCPATRTICESPKVRGVMVQQDHLNQPNKNAATVPTRLAGRRIGVKNEQHPAMSRVMETFG